MQFAPRRFVQGAPFAARADNGPEESFVLLLLVDRNVYHASDKRQAITFIGTEVLVQKNRRFLG
ncbi:hypothetical protein [Methylocystis iwaonis]|uniref:hypothetical protein n=1 Tax=Methylocystis iwaonis TaxID=2885079 RepID=UPI002E7AE674|nr:hypothetical protein [Methylocystis iwaonis]